MIVSMEPVLKRGYTAWDRDVLPVDEFTERQSVLRRLLAAQDLDALVVVNYSLLGAMFDYADIAWVGGLQSGGVVIVYGDRDPTLLTFGGGRELYFTREQTWIEHVVPGRGRTFEAAQALLAEHGIAKARIGVTGLGGMPVEAVARLRSAFDGSELVAVDAALEALRLVKRPRELLAIGIAKRITAEAAAAAHDVFMAGGDNTAAMLEAERVARFNKARDVRVLANMDDTGLRPFEGRLEGRTDTLLLWVAAQYHGYWAVTAVTAGEADGSPARSAVDAMAATLRGGATAGNVAVAGLAALPDALREIAAQYGFGGTVGLAQCDGIEIAAGSEAQLPLGTVVSLVCCAPVGAAPSIASRLVRVTDTGCVDVDATPAG
jgi:hypothetical protein